MTREYAKAAAKWWSDRLRDAAGVGDNGSRDLNSLMAGGWMYMIRDRHPPTEENCAAFEHELTNAIATLIERNDPTCWPDYSGFDDGGLCVKLGVDYHPDQILYGALLEAGVHQSVASMSALPLKTIMRVGARRVIVAHGYGHPWTEIWGPAWGASYEEQSAADRYRFDAAQIEHDAWAAAQPRWPLHEWQGCVPE